MNFVGVGSVLALAAFVITMLALSAANELEAKRRQTG